MEQRYGTEVWNGSFKEVWNGGMERVWSRSLFRTSYFDLPPYIYIHPFIHHFQTHPLKPKPEACWCGAPIPWFWSASPWLQSLMIREGSPWLTMEAISGEPGAEALDVSDLIFAGFSFKTKAFWSILKGFLSYLSNLLNSRFTKRTSTNLGRSHRLRHVQKWCMPNLVGIA